MTGEITMPTRRDERSPWKIEDVFPQLDQFRRSTQILTMRTGDKIWVRVFPGIAFCADHSKRKLQPAGSYLEWNSSLPAYCDSGYEIRPLLNSTELQDESKAMQNCVKEYDLLCEGDIARIFSIRHLASRTRVANALLMREDEDMTWELYEVSGPDNHPVHPAIHEVASRIADFYNQSERKTSSFDRLGSMDKATAKLTRMSTESLVID